MRKHAKHNGKPTKPMVCDVCGEPFKAQLWEGLGLVHGSFLNPCSGGCVATEIAARQTSCELLPAGVLTGEDRVVSSEVDVVSDITGDCYRSDFERLVGDWFCESLDEPFFVEPCTFPIQRDGERVLHYTPDFWLPRRDLFIEVKGRWGSGQRAKMELFLEQWGHAAELLMVPWRLREFFRGEDNGN